MLTDHILACYYFALGSQNHGTEVKENLDEACDDWRMERIICVRS